MSTWGVSPADGSGDGPHDPEDSMDLSELFAALRAPGTPDELAQAGSTVPAMMAAHAESAVAVVPLRSVDRRPALVAVGSALGVLAAVLVTGTAAAAYSGALPENLQSIAHDVIGAPAPAPAVPGSSASSDGRSTGGDGASEFTDTPANEGSGPAASLDSAALFGLCTAYADQGADDQNGDSVAFRVLSEAASAGNQTIEEYCAPILATKGAGKPSTPPGLTNKPSTPPGLTNKPTVAPGLTNKPTAAPGRSNKPSTTPGGSNKPTATPGRSTKPAPTRKPSVLPTGKPSAPPVDTGRPSASARP